VSDTSIFVPMVPVEELPDDLREQWEQTSRPGLRDFVRVMANAPDHFRRYNEAYLPLRFDNHLGPRLTEIVRLAVAQTTRCPVCMAGRVQAATDEGLTEELVAKLSTGDRAGFTDDECVALDYVLKLATDHQSIGDAERTAMREHFTPTQIVEINLLAVMCLVGRFSMVCGLEDAPS
jgi:AhpD family alkylhydroperoxidase